MGSALAQLAPLNKCHIRHLEYSLTWDRLLKRRAGLGSDGQVGIWEAELDVDGALGLGKVLYEQHLGSLESVLLSANYNRWVKRSKFSGLSPDQYLDRWWSLATKLSYLGHVRDRGSAIEKVRKAYQSRGRHGVLKDWQVTRHIWVALYDSPFEAIRFFQEGNGLQSLMIKKVALEFRKVPDASIGPDEIPIVLHTCGPLVGVPFQSLPDYQYHY